MKKKFIENQKSHKVYNCRVPSRNNHNRTYYFGENLKKSALKNPKPEKKF